MTYIGLTPAELLERLPQQKPFRFVDEIIAVNPQQISGTYTFRNDEYFYAGHFPGYPITPGVILLEAMSQVGLAAFGIYLRSLDVAKNELDGWLVVSVDVAAEAFKSVYPLEKVVIQAEKIYWKCLKLRSKIEMRNQAGELVASCIASGMGVYKS